VSDRHETTPGSGAALALGVGLLVVSWLFGSVAAAIAGFALVAVALAARAWRRAVSRALALERRVRPGPYLEGDTLRVELRLPRRIAVLGRATVREQIGALGTFAVQLRRGEGVLEIGRLARGRHPIGPAEVVVEDPLGLERVSAVAPPVSAVLVRPRTVELEQLFSDGAGEGMGGPRATVRRPSGLELHSLRDYQDGEPLRAVHWPSTARRGQLMVRELEDAPRDDVVIVLDGDPAGCAGPVGSTSYDEAVRAAASLVRAQAARGRRAVLVVVGRATTALRLQALDADWENLLDVLAAAAPDAAGELAGTLTDLRGPAARAPELVLVTARPSPRLGDRLVAARHGALVLVDAPTYAGASPSRPDPVALRLAAAGVPVAVVRRGDDLGAALAGRVTGRRSA
jgi:uncharacterized protein (DUF58 family)